MSGIEVAGLVLGAFPVAVDLLERYREVAKRMGFWYKIRLEYQKCNDSVRFYRVTFSRHLRQLLLPLVADDDEIKVLMSDPGGKGWKEPAMADLLEERLGAESYELYLNFAWRIQEVMEKLNHELAFDSQAVQRSLNAPASHHHRPTADARKDISDLMKQKSRLDARLKHTMTKEGMAYQNYRVKFSNGESTRTRLFAELESYITKLEKLLDTSDQDAKLVKERAAVAKSSAVDSSLVNFWRQASKFFRALSSPWNSCRDHQHWARLLLQHRAGGQKQPEFNMLFARAIRSSWEIRQTRIVEEDGVPPTVGFQVASATTPPSPKPPSLREHKPLKPTLKPPLITITPMSPSSQPTRRDLIHAVSNLCIALNEGEDSCFGYLAEEDCRYYVHRVSRSLLPDTTFSTVTLHQILRGDVQPAPSRRQRYALALILSSSFLQLLDTPWLPSSWSKFDIVFSSVEMQGGSTNAPFALDQPHLRSNLTPPPEHAQKTPTTTTFRRSLDLLGIVLLELCFGALLENQPCRKSWPAGRDEIERAAFDTMAAREWQLDVNEEAGPDYAEAVAWCLGGNRSTPPDLWRQQMLLKVVQPFERCREYLFS